MQAQRLALLGHSGTQQQRQTVVWTKSDSEDYDDHVTGGLSAANQPPSRIVRACDPHPPL